MLENKTDPIAFARDMVRLRRPLRLRGRWRPPKDGLYRVATSKKVHGARAFTFWQCGALSTWAPWSTVSPPIIFSFSQAIFSHLRSASCPVK